MRYCICQTSWCGIARTKHFFGNRTVSLTSDTSEREVWINHLEISGDDVSHVTALLDPWVWVGHFRKEDFTVISGDEGIASFNGIDFKSVTKYQESNTWNSSLTAPPRPTATKSLVMQSFLGDRGRFLLRITPCRALASIVVGGVREMSLLTKI